MRLAMVADWLTTFGGAEHVIAQCARCFPDAPLFATLCERGNIGPLAALDIRTTPLQRLYTLVRKHQLLLPLMPRQVEGIDLRGYDAVLSSSHAVAKGIVPSPCTLHVCYCHTPMRYAWDMEEVYLRDFRIPSPLRPIVRRMLASLRRWDLSTALRTDLFIANSTATQERIRRIYGRESVVLHPPVDEHFFQQELVKGKKHDAPYLAIGRMVPYKRFDILIEAANRAGFPLVIAGRGDDEARLRRMAGPTVRFLGFVPPADLASLYASSRALLAPQHEDAGIIPMEAQACGTPVITYNRGGVLDVMKEGVTGVSFSEQTSESVTTAIEHFQRCTFDPSVIRAHVAPYSSPLFRTKMKTIMEHVYRAFRAGGHRPALEDAARTALAVAIHNP